MNLLESLRQHPDTRPLAEEVDEYLQAWDAKRCTTRLWSGDAGLWTGREEGSWLGWLRVVSQQLEDLSPLFGLQQDVRREGFQHALLLGMGGSSLCPEVLAETFGQIAGYPRLHVLDSTDPAQVRDFETRIDFARTLFIVASKSGSTLEPSIFKSYFFDRARAVLGKEAATRFIAITDPGSQLEGEAKRDGFRGIYRGVKSIGGRYSALSNFGMVPAAVMGLDLSRFLREAENMARACAPGSPAADNPGVVLGTILGIAGRSGSNKVTLVASPGIRDLGAWLEQLLAESTGKKEPMGRDFLGSVFPYLMGYVGPGLIPVDRERLAPPEVYGPGRVFAYLRLESAPDPAQDSAIAALERAGRAVVRLDVASPYALGAEFFRWQVATAVAGAVFGIDPFDQPDVEASKVATRALTEEYERTGSLGAEAPFFVDGDLQIYADARNVEELERGAGSERSLAAYLRAHLARLGPGDYFALLAYVHMTARHEELLQSMRHRVRDARGVATCLGFGPRFLHSTGQAYKGGPNIGVFLQVTSDEARDLPVPGKRYSFGVVKAAQARGDFQVLGERGRRALGVHLGADVEAGLRALDAALAAALTGNGA